MNKFIPTIGILLLLLIYTSCKQQEQLWQAGDVTAENSFTTDCEGPACDKQGNLYAVNFEKQGTIGIVRTDKPAEVFVELPEGSTGNGIRFNTKGEMFVADFTGHNILRINPNTKHVTVFAHNREMNQPNDIAISNNNIIFASDPKWADNTGQIWRIDTDGSTTLLETGMGTTNGIEVSPDDKRLYVNESAQLKVWVYDLDEKGNVSGKKLFYQFKDHGLDGMRCDADGNLYIARYGKGTIAILAPDGKLLREVETKGKKTSNVTFGGTDGRTVYVTTQDRRCIESFRSDTKGAR